ncbi:hypothetical protein GIB67_020267 [Kingdonia uniflora]|uniref:Cation/H+ exchanger domain-containing protein n=1 Tax=Kingdonia uniflora TaxID=39325 RepID=A0A7J7P3R6_9MAGN|nr:hypothetical protein GIB67_020267 [Kingdonia uniflora]
MGDYVPQPVWNMANATVSCTFPYRTVSKGFFNEMSKDMSLFDFGLTTLMFQILLIYFSTQFLQFILTPLRQPKVVSQILVHLINESVLDVEQGGVLLGPVFFGKFQIATIMFPIMSGIPMGSFASVGVMLFQFLIGVKMDPFIVLRSGTKAMAIGFLSLIVPLLLSLSTNILLSPSFEALKPLQPALTFAGAAQSMTAFPVISSLLTELKILNSELGRLALSSAMISDQTYNILTMLSSGYRVQGKNNLLALYAVLGALVYVAAVIFIVRPVFIWMIKQTPEGEPVKEMYILLILLLVMISGLLSIILGQHIFFGPFILGLAVPDGPPLGMTLVNRLDSISSGLLVPLFFSISGLRTNIAELDSGTLWILVGIVTLCLVGKLSAAMLTTLYCKMPFRDSLSLALIMSSKGIVEMAIYNSWLDIKIIDQNIFSVMVLSVVVIAGVVTPLVSSLYDPARKYAGYIKRTVQHTKLDSELRIIACVYEQENVPGIINLLEASNPCEQSPLDVHALHLVELVGRAAPILITHHMWKQKSKQRSANPSRSEHIINAFRYLNEQSDGAIAVQGFTAISPFETIHDDICMLALDKKVPLIIVPFHKQWSADGTVDSSKVAWRTINRNVLELAPCSVAVLIDRGSTARIASQSVYHVGVIFLGGPDDREVLAYAKRMAADPKIRLHVVRLIPFDDADENEWQRMLDNEAIKNLISPNVHNERLVYKKEVVQDVEQTAALIREVESSNDLIMVGRRFGVSSTLTDGFTEWSECPELGIIGDMLASSDFGNKITVLVVQQQTVAK